MTNLHKKIDDMFYNDFNIQQELTSLSANGLDFDICDIKFTDNNEYKINIAKPKVSKSFLSKHEIINIPSLDFSMDSFTIDLLDGFELDKKSKANFVSTVNGFNTQSNEFDNIVDDLYEDFLKEIVIQEKNITDLFDLTINTSLEFLQESITKFDNKANSFIKDYSKNINSNKLKIDFILEQFKSSSTQEKVITAFKDKYFNTLVLKKSSLMKLQKHINTIRNSPWYSFSSVLSKIQLIIKQYEQKRYQYKQLKQKETIIYSELEELVNEAIENFILDRQELLDNKNLDTNIKLDKKEMFQYCLPLYENLLKKYNLYDEEQ